MKDNRHDMPVDSGEALHPETVFQTAELIRDAAPHGEPTGDFVTLDGEIYYRISDYHRLPPFLMSLASATDLWMFVTSGGGLTAGRVDADGSLFPYETVDRLHDAHHHSGPISLIRVDRAGEAPVLWRPFAGDVGEARGVERNLYKNTSGNRLVFEDVNSDLGLAFRYRWSGSDDFGWVRTATLENRGETTARISLLDGLRNVLPFGAPTALYQSASVLVDAYRKAEVDRGSRLGIFSLTAGITDRAEAAEVLRANTVWCQGLGDYRVHLSESAIEAFGAGRMPPAEALLNGRRSHYLVSANLELTPGAMSNWHMAADVGRSHLQIAELRRRILEADSMYWQIDASLKAADESLVRNVASADGLQLSADAEASVHHFANVLFNNMRGGVFADNHIVPTDDLIDFIGVRNRDAAERCAPFLEALPGRMEISDLLTASAETGDADLQRLCLEYLPLYFGRRHGDPSRPWNRFSINVRDRSGERALRYEGNWRDIFQNWEALCTAFPDFLPGVVAKFVNASTVDGFNPYRITREGLDWEIESADDPWSNIGYWGDHQIVYLLKLLEAMAKTAPGRLTGLLHREIFSYANVPYRIKPYAEILKDPHSTIDFSQSLQKRTDRDVRELGTDGKLLKDADDGIYHVNLLEKLLVPVLSKLSNLVVDGGIWMNTQRPEWNDANNALVGHGVSAVTLCYLRRFMVFFESLLADEPAGKARVSNEVADWFEAIGGILRDGRPLPAGKTIDDRDRKAMLDKLSGAFSDYRARVYADGFSGRRELDLGVVRDFCRVAGEYLDRGVRANRREDGLYNAYLLLEISDDGSAASIEALQEMLEGQVAALSSGLPDATEALRILETLFDSALYREDQNSFMLYPEKRLPGFLEKNAVSPESARAVSLLDSLIEEGDTSVIAEDAGGVCRFNADFRNAADLSAALDALDDISAVARDRDAVMDLFEDTFDHQSYTGRSGAMYAYEGLGSIYWHMVAKLLLAVQEIVLRAERESEPAALRQKLATMYYRIRAGLGFEKPVSQYGAFPTDPYSHTPPKGGARQPGMTGQVKEEVLTRLGELGVRVENGTVSFRPVLLRPEEFLQQPAVFPYYDIAGERQTADLPVGSLAFTFCQTLVIYERVEGEGRLYAEFADGTSLEVKGRDLDSRTSTSLLRRHGRIKRIRVSVPEAGLCRV